MQASRSTQDPWLASLASAIPTVDRRRADELDVDALLMFSLIDGQTTLSQMAEFLAVPLSTLVQRLRPLVDRELVLCEGLQRRTSEVHCRASLRPTCPAPPPTDALAICRGVCERRTLADENAHPFAS